MVFVLGYFERFVLLLFFCLRELCLIFVLLFMRVVVIEDCYYLFSCFWRFVLSLFCCLWELCLSFVLLGMRIMSYLCFFCLGGLPFSLLCCFFGLSLWELRWRAHLLSGEGPPGHLPDDKAKGVHIRCLERLKTGLVQRLIQHLKWHIIENWGLSKRSHANKPLEPCSALFLLWCWGRCRFRLFHCQTWSRESCRIYKSLYLSVWQI